MMKFFLVNFYITQQLYLADVKNSILKMETPEIKHFGVDCYSQENPEL